MTTVKLSDIRAKFPMYSDLPDGQLIKAVRDKFYSDIPAAKFLGMVEFDTKTAELNKQLTDSMSPMEKFLAGTGKAFADTGRGISQLFGQTSQAEATQNKQLDAPLMDTGAGLAGNVVGNMALAIPTFAIPGAAGLRGAAVIGGAQGLMQPVAEGDSRLGNTALGAGAGAAGVAVGRAALGVGQGVKALAEPFYQGGRDKIAGRVLQRFMEDPTTLARATSAPTITGARPTLAEQTGDAGLARLQDALRSVDPQINNQIGGRLAENNAARVNSLLAMTGRDGGRDFAVANRAGTAGPMYQQAFGVVPDAQQMTPAMQRQLQTLLRAPAIQAAMKDARAIGANSGTNVGSSNATGSIEGLHNMKMALDDAINTATNAGQTAKAQSIKKAQEGLVSLMETMSPEYATARTVYRQMSAPINAMDVVDTLAKKGLSNGSDLAGNQTINRNALLGALKNEPALIRQATGRNAGKSLADVLDPQQLAMVRAVASEADRAGAVATAGNGPGSATAQRMASQNILRQLVGPTGLPQSWAESALANTVIGKPLNLIYGGVAEPLIQKALAGAVLDPASARAVLQAAQQQGMKLPQNVLTKLLLQAGRTAPASIALSQPG